MNREIGNPESSRCVREAGPRCGEGLIVNARSVVGNRRAPLILAIAATLLGSPSDASAQDDGADISWIGRKVVLREPAPLGLGGEALADWTLYPIFTVEKKEGERILIVFQGAREWIGLERVVAFDRATDYFTREIGRRPPPPGHTSRGDVSGLRRATLRVRSRISGPRSGSIGSSRRHSLTGPGRGSTRRIMTAPSPTCPRPSASIPGMPGATNSVAPPGMRRASSTRR